MLKFNELILLTLRNSDLSNSTNYTYSFQRRRDYTVTARKKKNIVALGKKQCIMLWTLHGGKLVCYPFLVTGYLSDYKESV